MVDFDQEIGEKLIFIPSKSPTLPLFLLHHQLNENTTTVISYLALFSTSLKLTQGKHLRKFVKTEMGLKVDPNFLIIMGGFIPMETESKAKDDSHIFFMTMYRRREFTINFHL
ncbi:unnamed protein product [Vicia faba]|uniref:Uncharacterized protein n=1 Tax=Vicia faba TaxID=3906 RepID=A0AAV0YGH7_VICFA|nr:unnamed protein product [Vicia faba]